MVQLEHVIRDLEILTDSVGEPIARAAVFLVKDTPVERRSTVGGVIARMAYAERQGQSDTPDEGHPHLINGDFQSDKYPLCPRGKVPLSVKDVTAQDLLWEYAQRRRSVDAEFAADLELALRNAGYKP